MFDWLKRSTPSLPGKPSRVTVASPRAYESNTIVLIDTSYSVGQEMVDFAVRKGLPAIAGSMLSASTRNGIVYNLGVMTFASDVREGARSTNGAFPMILPPRA